MNAWLGLGVLLYCMGSITFGVWTVRRMRRCDRAIRDSIDRRYAHQADASWLWMQTAGVRESEAGTDG
jgi:hypothetical protein